MKLFAVFADLGNDRKEFHGVFGTQDLAEAHIEITDKGYGFKICYWEEIELNKG